jgi:cytochrome c
MSGLELNKIAASILLAGLIAMIVGNIADILYRPLETPEKRGFQVDISAENPAGAAPAAAVPVDLGALLAAANADKGKETAKKCAACHTFAKGEPNKIGPNLYGIVGNKKGHAADFAYSPGMLNFAGDKTWSYGELYQFINHPQKHVPGTKMGFAGLDKPEDIANVISFLRTLSDSPTALPKPGTMVTPEK